MTSPQSRREPFVHLVDLAHDRALVAWGAFHFTRATSGDRWRLVGSEELHRHNGRRTSIGSLAEPYGAGTVQVFAPDGTLAAEASTSDHAWVWVEGLSPDTEYRYQVLVDGSDWVEGERWSWAPAARGGYDLAPAGWQYDLRFTTWPDPEAPTPVTRFVALGDFGVGIGSDTESSRRQRRVAEVVDTLVRDHDVRFLLSLGDTIYQGRDRHIRGGNGDRDDDWYAAFFEPYRYAIARVPVFPAIGNHDNDADGSDNREQMEDNFHVRARFHGTHRASITPGLFYRVQYGRDLVLVCVDTSVDLHDEHVHRLFQEEVHRQWLEDTLTSSTARWVIPFSHHPAYCAGPSHDNDGEMIETLVPLFDRAGVRLALAGHEHSFQVNEVDGRTYVISGAGGKVEEGLPADFARAGTTAWGAQSHLLLLELDEDELRLTPVSGLLPDGGLHLMTPLTPGGQLLEPTFSLSAPDH